jgi:hypothetical protein
MFAPMARFASTPPRDGTGAWTIGVLAGQANSQNARRGQGKQRTTTLFRIIRPDIFADKLLPAVKVAMVVSGISAFPQSKQLSPRETGRVAVTTRGGITRNNPAIRRSVRTTAGPDEFDRGDARIQSSPP